MEPGGYNGDRSVWQEIGKLDAGKASAADLERLRIHALDEARRADEVVLERAVSRIDDVKRSMGELKKEVEMICADMKTVEADISTMKQDLSGIQATLRELSQKPSTTLTDWVYRAIMVFGIAAAIVSGQWGAVASFLRL